MQLLAFAFLAFNFADEARPEGWSDSALPPAGRNGLVLWLDAATIEAAAKTAGKPAPTPGAPLDQWSDGSGAGRHFIAPKSSNRPRYIKQQERPYVEFDGEDDYFTYFGKPIKARESTIFVVAAPYANNGAFRGLVAAAPPALNDYTHGFNLDLGSNFSARWDMLNFEGAGAGGQRNLLQESAPFGALRRLAVVVGKDVRLFVNGKPEGRRPRETSLLSLERWTVGARHFSNESRPPYAQGFLEGAIAEVLVYDRLLSDSERRAVEQYLAKKHPPDVRLASGRKPARGIRFAPLENPPAVQMLAPGFESVALPVKLPNINYLRYRRDGKLFAGGYNGKIYLLADTDGDGVEDSSKLYWESPTLKVAMGMAVAPPGHPKGDGLYVLSVGRLVFLPDRNGDDKADEEIVVAEGWAPARVATQGVSDGLGLAIAPDGSFYFGLGTSDFTDAYLLRGGAKAAYDPKGERGTMQKVSADWSRREQICSGLRFTVGVAVDAAGHVFCTDQEGATWLSNGNPFDELLHIQRGRHYGFPPRHPRHNPDVIDEPSLFDYSPQHQSTCGMNFNRDDAFGKKIGPDFWANDALVVGQSRGKLFRTKIVPGHADFVAANSLLGCVQTLPVDVATTPDGGLVVCGHSGGPDWGTGPAGIGVIYKIRQIDKSAPQPVAGWFSSPGEIQIAFDRPLSDEWVRSIPKSAKLDFGPHVQPGDRFETFRPGYAVVARQMMAWRDQISLGDAAVTADRRTLLLRTNPMFDAVGYAASLPSPAKLPPAKSGAIRGREEIDVGVGATGVEVEANVGADRWSGWLPHPELKVALALLQGSASHARLGELLARKEPTGLKLRTQMRLADLLRPAVQPGDKIDYVWPKESAIVTFASFGQITLKSARGIVTAGKDDAGRNTAILTVRDAAAPVAIELEVAAPAGAVDLACWFHTEEDPRRRPLPLRRFLLPWAREESATAEQAPVDFPELAGGDWGRGRRLFLGEKAACAKCHVLDGGGGTIGPSLDNVRRRDYASVRRDLLDPNFALNPEHLSYLVAAKDGRQFAGVMRTEGDVIKIGTAEGQIVALAKNEVESIKPSGKSIMPANLGTSLGEADLRDLLTYLLREPPRLPIPPGMQIPKPRKLADVQAVLAGSETIKDPSKLKLLLVSGPKDHGPGEHDYPAWKKAWSELFAVAPGVDVEAVDGWPTEKQWDEARAAVIYQHGTFDAKRARDIDRFLERGGGLSYVHWAVDGAPDGKGLAARIGLAAGGPIKFRHGPLALEFAKEPHPITRNVRNFPMVDESYWMLAGDPAKIRTLGWSPEDGKLQPQYWTVEQGRGRVFVSIPGHFSHSFQDPFFRILLFRGILWSAREPVDRFNELVLLGADVEK